MLSCAQRLRQQNQVSCRSLTTNDLDTEGASTSMNTGISRLNCATRRNFIAITFPARPDNEPAISSYCVARAVCASRRYLRYSPVMTRPRKLKFSKIRFPSDLLLLRLRNARLFLMFLPDLLLTVLPKRFVTESMKKKDRRKPVLKGADSSDALAP